MRPLSGTGGEEDGEDEEDSENVVAPPCGLSGGFLLRAIASTHQYER